MPDFSKAQVGDKVWSFADGWGEVEAIGLKNIHVIFPDGTKQMFTKDGKLSVIDKYPILHWDEIKFEEPPRPKRRVKRQGWVNVRTVGDGRICRYIHDTKELAEGIVRSGDSSYVTTAFIEWEEEE